ncbi:MAG: PorV/PorQ family protein [Elusimicrobia bacterium]|nr:PorV/PorQ family protein [Elusimicrobiota bacterium]
MNVETGARPAGVSGAFTAVADDANAVRWNPAGLRQLPRHELAFSERSFFGDLRLYDVNFARHFGDHWSGGVGVSMLDYGKIEHVNNLGEGTKDPYGARDLLVSFAAARDFPVDLLDGRVRLGGGARVVRREIEVESTNGYVFDLAGHWERDRWRLGATLQNLGPAMGFGRERIAMPVTLRVGAAYEPVDRLTASADLVERHEGDPSLRGGLEVTAARVQWTDLVVRAGFSTTEGAEHGFSAGLGIVGLNWEFAYSWKMLGELDFGHWVGLTYRFNRAQARVTPQEFSRRKAAAMYDRLMRWYDAQKQAGRLTRKYAISVLERVISRYEPLAVDVAEAKKELDRVKAGAPLGKRRDGKELDENAPLPAVDPFLEDK